MAVTLADIPAWDKGGYAYQVGGYTTDGVIEFIGDGWVNGISIVSTHKTIKFKRTDADGNTQTAEMQVHGDGTVHVSEDAMKLMLGELGFEQEL